ncbi:MAG: kelch-like protein, partial [candidate division NC10 bacterium]|nr:kelch-like protein [candidate division NC10 bacterium]
MSTARRYHAAAKLLNGRVVVSGGYTTSYLTSSEMFDPGNPGWSPGGDMKAARIRHTATTLNNGKVLVTGGLGTPGGL